MTNFKLIFSNLLKKDWKKLLVMLLGLVYFAVFYVPVISTLYRTKAELLAMFETLKNPAMIALVGPTEATSQTVTIASFYFQEMTLFTALIFILVGMLHVISRTRAEEEEGLSELVLSFPVGKLTQSVAVLLELTIFYLTSGVLMAGLMTVLTRPSDGFTLTANVLYSFGLALTGLMFSALALVIVQLFATATTVRTASFMIFGVLYIGRAFTDISALDFSRFNPLAWIYLMSLSVGNHGGYLLVMLVLTVLLSLVALKLQTGRDVSGSLLIDKEKRHQPSKLYSTILGFVIKNAQSQVVIWLVSALLMGASYGSIFGDIDSFIKDNATIQAMFVVNPNFNLAEQFISVISMILVVLAIIPVIALIGRLGKDERLGRLDLLFVKTSRVKLLLMTWLSAVLLGILTAEIGGLGLYLAESAVMQKPIGLSTVLSAVTVFLPTVLVFASLAVFLLAINRKLLNLAWFYLTASFIIDYLGSMLKLDKIFHQLTPFYWVPRLPVGQMTWAYVIVMCGVGLLLLAVSCLIYRRRDI
jgi:ABC-2 type transport system permease protein